MKLSIILPCYNVSWYISRCLDSIFSINLTNEDFEVLCVDDCSADGTIEIIRSYAEKHPNLSLILHTENKASGGARNTGLRAAKGEYIWYIDPDDMIYPEHVNAILDSCLDNNLDVICFNYEDIDEQENIISQPIVFKDSPIMSGIEFAHINFGDSFVYHFGYVVRFFYKRQFLLDNNLFFPENTCWQDTIYMPQAILFANRVQGSSELVYRYWHHDSSVCGSFNLSYSGIKTYQWVFNAGYYVLQLSCDIRNLDTHYSDLFYNFAHTHYFNKMPIFLCRTIASQRTTFYQQIRSHPDRVKEVYPYLNRLSKFLLCPIIGPLNAHMLAGIYKLTPKKH